MVVSTLYRHLVGGLVQVFSYPPGACYKIRQLGLGHHRILGHPRIKADHAAIGP